MGVKIEIFRMILYLSFPVAMFWISNQAEYFEERVVKRQRELLPPEKLKVEKQRLEELKRKLRLQNEQKMLTLYGVAPEKSD
ncbi:hypothetical protein DNTS_031023 [Danionella cerebrum]|uniref:Protein PET100 homolog, mitochondrial n=1 Tax=Danionella cerebrum TaxID=2873325 RepID=A0A553MUR6_9TELE|nr:hypothetical protein DNTS_031023 [Danionella translucida]